MAEHPLRLAVFDLAGTTVQDPGFVGGCLEGALLSDGVRVDGGDVARVMGLPKRHAIRLLLEGRGEACEPGRVEEIHRRFVERMVDVYERHPGVVEIDGTSECFARLRAAGIQVAIDTGFDRHIATVLFARLAWAEKRLLDADITSDEVAQGRPAPDMVLALARRLGITDLGRVAKIGDTPSDLQEGTRAGCGMVVGVMSGSHGRDELARHPHTHLIDSVAAFPGLLGL